MLNQHKADHTQGGKNMDHQYYREQIFHVVSLFRGGAANRQEISSNQRSATNQTAVDIRHAEQLDSITRLYAPAIKDLQTARNTSVGLCDLRANCSMHFLSLLRSRGAAGTDRPNWLVRNHCVGKRSNTDTLQNSINLCGNDIDGLTRFALSQGLANAENRPQTSRQGRCELLRDDRVRFAIDRPTLGVTDKHVTARKVLQHRSTDFASEGTLRMLTQSLRTPSDNGTGQSRLRLRQIGERNTNGNRYAIQVSCTCNYVLKQLLVGLQTTVHFPVSCYELLAHKVPRKKVGIIVRQGRTGQSVRASARNSDEAKPVGERC